MIFLIQCNIFEHLTIFDFYYIFFSYHKFFIIWNKFLCNICNCGKSIFACPKTIFIWERTPFSKIRLCILRYSNPFYIFFAIFIRLFLVLEQEKFDQGEN